MPDSYFVTIACPWTGKAIRTGLWLRELEEFERFEMPARTVACPHCDSHHDWLPGDAWLERTRHEDAVGDAIG